MFILIRRHIKLFFDDKLNVFFSLLSIGMIVLLYILFLKDNLSSHMSNFNNRDPFIFFWLFSGVLAVTTATTPLGAFGKMIEDKVYKKDEDLRLGLIHQSTLTYSYIFYSLIIGFILTMILLGFGYFYVFIKFDERLNLSFMLLLTIFLSISMHSLLFYFIVSNFKTMSAFSSFSTIVGTFIGFLAGIYIPIGLLPLYIQKLIFLFPTTHPTVLIKNLLMTDILQSLPEQEFGSMIYLLGIKLKWDDYVLPTKFSFLYIIFLIILFLSFIFWEEKI